MKNLQNMIGNQTRKLPHSSKLWLGRRPPGKISKKKTLSKKSKTEINKSQMLTLEMTLRLERIYLPRMK